jgi:phage terminase large subunit GpA-like protein
MVKLFIGPGRRLVVPWRSHNRIHRKSIPFGHWWMLADGRPIVLRKASIKELVLAQYNETAKLRGWPQLSLK